MHKVILATTLFYLLFNSPLVFSQSQNVQDFAFSLSSSEQTVIVKPGRTLVVKGNFSIPQGLTLKVHRGGLIKISKNSSLKFEGFFECGLHQAFIYEDETSEVDFGKSPISVVHPEWWYDKNENQEWSVAINRAFQSLGANNVGGVVKLSGRTYTTKKTIYFGQRRAGQNNNVIHTNSGRQLVGTTRFTTKISYDNPEGGAVIASHPTTHTTGMYDYISNGKIANLMIFSSNADRGIDFSGFSYSIFSDLNVIMRNPKGIAFYGQGNQGSSPYYNVFEKIHVNMGNFPHTRAFVLASGAWFGSSGPNGNFFHDIMRIAPAGIGFDIQAGNGNMFQNINMESLYDAGFAFGRFDDSQQEGIASGGDETELIDKKATWQNDQHNNKWVWITSGTGSGQARQIKKTSPNTLHIARKWTIPPDSTSCYVISWVFEGRVTSDSTSTTGDSYSLYDTFTDFGEMNHVNLGIQLIKDDTSTNRKLGSTYKGIFKTVAPWSGEVVPKSGDRYRIWPFKSIGNKITGIRVEGISGGPDFVELYPGASSNRIDKAYVSSIGKHIVLGGTGDHQNQIVPGRTVRLVFTLNKVGKHVKDVKMFPESRGIPQEIPVGGKAVITGIWMHSSAYRGGKAIAKVRAHSQEEILSINEICPITSFKGIENVSKVIGGGNGISVQLSTEDWSAENAAITVIVRAVLYE